MAADTLLVVSRARLRDLVRAFSRPRLDVSLCRPEKTLECLKGSSARAVIVDGGRKQGEDLRLIGRIKASCPGVPVIYLAEGGSERTAVEAFRKGARDYYSKPVNIYDLRRNVMRLIALQKTAAGRRRPYLWSPLQTGDTMRGVGSGVQANLLRALAYMEDNYDGSVSLADLAEQAGMSRYHFCRVFRKAMGESPIRHLIRLRMERAKAMLLTTDLAVSEIASLVGFEDLAHFSRTFRRWCSLTPSRYREARAQR